MPLNFFKVILRKEKKHKTNKAQAAQDLSRRNIWMQIYFDKSVISGRIRFKFSD